MKKSSKINWRWIFLLVVTFLPTFMASGAMLYLEDFDPDANGWGDRDAGEMSVTHDGGNDWMVGSFASSFLPMTDAFRISTGTDFLGDYVTPGLSQISFQLYAVNVLPSDLFIRIIDGANTFSYQFTPANLTTWDTYTVNLDWSFGWVGPGSSAFSNALLSVDALEIQITRSGSGAQTYYLDNVQTYTNLNVVTGTIPEPGTINLFLVAGAVITFIRRRVATSDAEAG